MDEASDASPVRVVIVDDHELLRAGTRQILNEATGIEVVGEAADGAAALDVVAATCPDVLLVDIRLPDKNGIEVAREVASAHPTVHVVVLSAYDDDDYVQAALQARVSGYLLKTMPGDELVRAIRLASGGTTVLDPAVTARLARTGRAAEAGSTLTWRERQVVEQVAEGLPNKTIARNLGISARTVEGHLNHVFTKLAMTSRTELVRFAIANRMTLRAGAPPDYDAGADGP